jgi:UDP-N-acetylmuramyl pentapeptide phosphotransferase/UDP-N-acetylglucosamine-1-phosphate transferase
LEPIGGDPGASLFSGSLVSRLDAADQLIQKAGRRFPALESSLPGLNARGLLLAILTLALLLLVPKAAGWLLRVCKQQEPNFQGQIIPRSFGIVILICSALLFGAIGLVRPALRAEVLPWLIVVIGFGGLGLLDDVRGDKRIKGLRGHFRAAWRERRITTGLIKALGGLGVAVWSGGHLFPDQHGEALLAAGLIALSANAINLLDVRPGRAGAVFLLLAMLLIGAAWRGQTLPAGVPLLLFVALPALAVWNQDARGRVMMGDAGSNLLGASLGLAFVQLAPSLACSLCVLVLLLGMHLLAERVSLTVLIERTRLLRALDRWTGMR